MLLDTQPELSRVSGQPHWRNLDRWTSLVECRDARRLRRVLTGLDRDSIEMREVSPMGRLLSQDFKLRFDVQNHAAQGGKYQSMEALWA